MKRIQVTFTRTRFEKLLGVLDGGPFIGVEYTPEQLRALSDHLREIAVVSEDLPCTGKRWSQSVVSYPLCDELQ